MQHKKIDPFGDDVVSACLDHFLEVTHFTCGELQAPGNLADPDLGSNGGKRFSGLRAKRPFAGHRFARGQIAADRSIGLDGPAAQTNHVSPLRDDMHAPEARIAFAAHRPPHESLVPRSRIAGDPIVAGQRRGILGRGAQVDRDLLVQDCEATLFTLGTLRPFERDPLFYNDILGNSTLFITQISPDAAEFPERMASLVSRMKRFPGFLEQAKKNEQKMELIRSGNYS